jgi:hypothetical protein
VGPGDDGPCGTPTTYRTFINGQQRELGLTPVAGGSAFTANISLQKKVPAIRQLTIQAIDKAGNIGPAVTVGVHKKRGH